MLHIQTTLTTNTGDVITEAYGRLGISIPEEADIVIVNLKLYRAADSLENGFNNFTVLELAQYSLREEIIPSQYALLSVTNIHNFIKDKLENILGADTVTVIL